MQFHPTPLHGAYVLEMDKRRDARGFFARLFCEDMFRARGLTTHFPQVNHSCSVRKHTLRGLHYQLPPAADVKLVRVMKGAVYDVLLDLRPDSPSYGRHFTTELDDRNHHTLYIPGGVAHGFLTLREDTEVLYLVSAPHTPDCERGVRWNDPHHGIHWPAEPAILSEKDRIWPDFDPAYHGIDRMKGMA